MPTSTKTKPSTTKNVKTKMAKRSKQLYAYHFSVPISVTITAAVEGTSEEEAVKRLREGLGEDYDLQFTRGYVEWGTLWLDPTEITADQIDGDEEIDQPMRPPKWRS